MAELHAHGRPTEQIIPQVSEAGQGSVDQRLSVGHQLQRLLVAVGTELARLARGEGDILEGAGPDRVRLE